MLKYDHQLTEVKSRLLSANSILIVLPQNLTVDNLSAGLSLALSLKNSGKKVDVVSTGTPLVAQSNLYGIGDIKKEVSSNGTGNYIISLDGVVDATGTMQKVPALENVDWYPEGSKLNVVFHVVPGQRFEPTNITSRHEQSGYDLTVVVGCQSLNELGNVFISNSQFFAQSQVINIDNNPLNSYFGFANVIDPQASSLSEIVAHILPSLTLNMDPDAASNIIAGIYNATNNLTTKVNPDTFLAVSQAVQFGGQLPQSPAQAETPIQPEIKIDYQLQNQPAATPVPQYQPPVAPQPQSQPEVSYQPIQQESPVSQPVQTQPLYSEPANSLQSSPFIVPPQDIFIPASPVQPENVAGSAVPQFDFNQAPMPQAEPAITQAPVIPSGNAEGFDLRQIFQIPQMPSGSKPSESAAPVVSAQPQPAPASQPQYVGGNPENHFEQPAQVYSSPEDKPTGESTQGQSPEIESTPTPDWLVPKIFKGGNLG